MPWLLRWAAMSLSRFQVGQDGKTAYEKTKGKKPTVLGVEFGEKVLYKLKPAQKMEKINSRCWLRSSTNFVRMQDLAE